jgi:hypothetical protein
MKFRLLQSVAVKRIIITLLIIFGFSSLTGFSQNLKTINLGEIPQRKVRKYIVSRSIDHMSDFSSIHPSWKKDMDESAFNVIEKTFYLKFKLSNVWNSYIHANPVKMWNGKYARLGLMISKCSNTVIYTNNPLPPDIDTGQVYFLSLRFLIGLLHIPAAFEIINIDQDKQIVELSYIDNNKSLGKQTIQFFENGEGRTRIIHRSYFKSESSRRDELFYPHFHNKFIKDFHRNMKHLIKSTELTVPVLIN